MTELKSVNVSFIYFGRDHFIARTYIRHCLLVPDKPMCTVGKCKMTAILCGQHNQCRPFQHSILSSASAGNVADVIVLL